MLGHGLKHLRRIEETLIIWKDQRRTIFNRLNARQEIIIIDSKPALLPFPATRFKNPQPHHVLEKANGAERAAFVSKIVARDPFVDERIITLDTNQRPRARRDIGPTVFERRACDCAPRVMRRGRDNTHTIKSEFTAQRRLERS